MPLERLGPYSILRPLGRGGMGAVYAAREQSSGRVVAVKVLSGHLADDEAFRERFIQEIETLKRLQHPSIVQLYGFGEEDGNLYYAMEYVEGSNLHEELMRGRRFTWREVARMGIAIAMALKHAHDHGIIHRDLKPGNLLLDEAENVKLADFGIAKLYGGANVTAAGGVLGTADYMAPEQAAGQGITGRCDLYSLGSVLYALLTGKPPFAGRTMYDVMAALKNERPVPVRRLAPDMPEEFERIVMQLLEKSPQDRIPTALALANRLRAMEHALSLETRVLLTEEGVGEAARRDEAMTEVEEIGEERQPNETMSTALDPAGGEALPPERMHADPKGRTEVSRFAAARTELRAQQPEGAGEESRMLEAAAPGPPVSRYVAVDPQAARVSAEGDEHWAKQWPVLLMLGLFLAAAVTTIVLFARQAPSADRLYATVKGAAEAGPESIATVEGELGRFLADYAADPRAEEMRRWQEELEQYRFQKQFELRTRRGANWQELKPIERACLEAMQLAASDPAAAVARFQAIVDLFGDSQAGDVGDKATETGDKATAQCLELATQQIERLRPIVEKGVAEQQGLLRARLDRAGHLAASDRAAAERIWKSIIVLYAEKAWAEELVSEARRRMREQGEMP